LDSLRLYVIPNFFIVQILVDEKEHENVQLLNEQNIGYFPRLEGARKYIKEKKFIFTEKGT
jgi:hypothetical protein